MYSYDSREWVARSWWWWWISARLHLDGLAALDDLVVLIVKLERRVEHLVDLKHVIGVGDRRRAHPVLHAAGAVGEGIPAPRG